MESMDKKTVKKILITYFVIFYLGYNIILSNVILFIFGADISLYLHTFVELVVFIAIILFSKKKLLDDFNKIKIKNPMNIAFMVIGANFFMNFTNIIVNIIIMQFTTVETSNNQLGIELMFERYPVYIVMTAVIFAPIVEELVFRGTIYSYMRQKMNFIWCAILNSFIFAGLHFTVSLLTGDLSDIIFLLAYMSQSFIICYIYEKTDNIFLPIVLHFMNNALAVLSMFLI